MSPDTKAARIRRLYEEGKRSRKEIANEIGCSQEYVRVVLQRMGEVKPRAKPVKSRLMQSGQRYFTQPREPP